MVKNISKLDLSRVAIFGGSGSGKSYLAMELGKIMRRTPIHVDDLHHGPEWTALPPNMLVKRVNRRIQKDNWIIDGNYSKVRSQILENCTFIIMIRIPLIHQLKQLIVRSVVRAFHFLL